MPGKQTGVRKRSGGKKNKVSKKSSNGSSGSSPLPNIIGDYFHKIRLENILSNSRQVKPDNSSTITPSSDNDSWSVISRSSPQDGLSSPYSGSDILYPHESWITYKHKAKALAEQYFGGRGEIKVTPIHGGSYNRVVNILIDGQSSYILRIPRAPDKSDVEGEVAPLVFLRRHTPILSPRVIAYETGSENLIHSPYMIQERLPGICLYPAWAQSVADEQKLRVAHDLGVVFRQILNTRSSRPGRLCFREGQAGLDAQVFVVPIRPKYEVPWHLHSAEGAQPWDPNVSLAQQQQSVADFMTSLIQSRRSNALKRWPRNKKGHEILARLVDVIADMEQRGHLRDVQYSLYHWDIAARNIIFNPAAKDVLGSSCLGMIDWDDCVFAPSFMPCEPPAWVWKPSQLRSISAESLGESMFSDEADEGAEDNEVSARLRQVFTDTAGPEYRRYSEDPVYEIARKITEYGMKGTRSGADEYGKEAEQLLNMWQDYIKN